MKAKQQPTAKKWSMEPETAETIAEALAARPIAEAVIRVDQQGRIYVSGSPSICAAVLRDPDTVVQMVFAEFASGLQPIGTLRICPKS